MEWLIADPDVARFWNSSVKPGGEAELDQACLYARPAQLSCGRPEDRLCELTAHLGPVPGGDYVLAPLLVGEILERCAVVGAELEGEQLELRLECPLAPEVKGPRDLTLSIDRRAPHALRKAVLRHTADSAITWTYRDYYQAEAGVSFPRAVTQVATVEGKPGITVEYALERLERTDNLDEAAYHLPLPAGTQIRDSVVGQTQILDADAAITPGELRRIAEGASWPEMASAAPDLEEVGAKARAAYDRAVAAQEGIRRLHLVGSMQAHVRVEPLNAWVATPMRTRYRAWLEDLQHGRTRVDLDPEIIPSHCGGRPYSEIRCTELRNGEQFQQILYYYSNGIYQPQRDPPSARLNMEDRGTSHSSLHLLPKRPEDLRKSRDIDTIDIASIWAFIDKQPKAVRMKWVERIGRRLVELYASRETGAEMQPGFSLRVWLDPQHGYFPVRVECDLASRGYRLLEVAELVPLAEDLWLPTDWTFRHDVWLYHGRIEKVSFYGRGDVDRIFSVPEADENLCYTQLPHGPDVPGVQVPADQAKAEVAIAPAGPVPSLGDMASWRPATGSLLIDLDTGRTYAAPAGEVWGNASAFQAWIRRNGIDAFWQHAPAGGAGSLPKIGGALVLFDAAMQTADANDWFAPKASAIHAALADGVSLFGPQALVLTKEQTPAVLYVRTAEGGMAIAEVRWDGGGCGASRNPLQDARRIAVGRTTGCQGGVDAAGTRNG